MTITENSTRLVAIAAAVAVALALMGAAMIAPSEPDQNIYATYCVHSADAVLDTYEVVVDSTSTVADLKQKCSLLTEIVEKEKAQNARQHAAWCKRELALDKPMTWDDYQACNSN